MDKLTGFCDVDEKHILNGSFFVWKVELPSTGGMGLRLFIGTDISLFPAKDGYFHACGKGCMIRKLDELTDQMFKIKEVTE